MINRDLYIDKLVKWKDKQVIKVLTGMRRVGKSTLLLMFKDYLIQNGVNEKNIIYFNLEDLKYDDIDNYIKLYDEITKLIDDDKMNYIMIDEIQNVNRFEKAIDSLFIKNNVDIYLTGSNARLLSGEIATLLTGRYIEINVLPLSFKEYISDFDGIDTYANREELFQNYMSYGGLPFVKTLNNDKEEIEKYLDSIYSTVYAKDILKRMKIRKTIEKVSRFMFDNISNITSINKISNQLKNEGATITAPTVDIYLDALCSAYLFYKVNRYDTKGKTIFKSQYKYYTVDIGLRNYVAGVTNRDLGRMLENLVYLELIRRGYNVYIGRVRDKEIDFVAEKSGMMKYFQIASTILDEKTFLREITPLRAIDDNYEKYILTFDKNLIVDDEGIRIVNVIDYLLQDD